jgi:prepilin-type N-terminal cleavage/methylation domain-containing protein
MKRDTSNKKGFTLVELLVTMAVASIVIIAIYSLYTYFLKTSTGQDRLLEIQQESRIAMEIVVKEVRASGCYYRVTPIITAEANRFEFEADTDPDPTKGPWKIRYDRDTTNNKLQRSFAEWDSGISSYGAYTLNQPVANQITGLTFSYYDENGILIPAPISSLANRDRIRRVDIQIQAQTDKPNPLTTKFDTVTLDTSIYLRCMGVEQSTDTTACANPTNVAISNPGLCGRIDLTWDRSSDPDAAGYKVYYRPSGSAFYSGLLDVPGGNTESYQITGLDDGTEYEIAMQCYDTAGNINAAFEGPVTATPSDTAPPDVPTGVDATSGDGFVTVSWTGSSAVDTGGYNIWRSDDGGTNWTNVAEVDSTNVSYQETTITNCPLQPYQYRVTSWDCAPNETPYTDASVSTVFGDGAGAGADQPTSGVTDTNPTETTAPQDPTNFTAIPGATKIYMSYATPSDTDLKGVRILRKDDGGAGGGPYYPTDENDAGAVGPNGQKDYEPLVPIQTYSLTDSSGINLNWTYYYRAFAYDGCANFSPGTISQATAQPCGDAQFPGAPDAPLNATADVCSGATINWSPPTTYDVGKPFTPAGTDDLVGYYIYRNTTGVFSAGDIITSDPITTTTFSDSGIVPGTTYYYWVTAVDCADNEGPPTGPITVIPSGIDWDTSIDEITYGTSGIDGSQHNIVRLGIKNLGNTDVTLDSATITWLNTTAYIKNVKLTPYGSSTNELWDDTTLPLTASGFTIDFTAYQPDAALRRLSAGSTLNELVLELRESDNGGYVDMRGDTITVILGYTNDDAGSTCTASTFNVPVPLGPTITNSKQNKPTEPTTSNLNTGTVVVAAGTQDASYVWTLHTVTVQATITPEIGTTISSATLYYATTGKSTTTPPSTDYSSSPTGWTSVTMCQVGSSDVYQTDSSGLCTSSPIPANLGDRVWYYVKAVDDDTNYDIQPEPSVGIYTYDQESQFDITLTVTRSGTGNKTVAASAALTDEDTAAVSGADVTMTITGTGVTTETGTMTEGGTAGTYEYTSTTDFTDKTITVVVTASKDTFTDANCGAADILKTSSSTVVTCD